MATKDYYKGVTIQYKGDDTQLSKVLADMNSQMRQSQGAARQLDAALRMDPKSLNLIKDRAEVVAKQIKVTEERIAALKQALQSTKDPEVITRLTQQVDIAEARLKNLNEQMDKLGERQNMGSGFGQLATNMQNVGDSMQDIGNKMSSVGDKMTTHLTMPIVGFSAAAIGAATTVDSALTDVRKTVDGTEEDYQKLKNAAIEYSKTNAVSADQVLQVQALGAQLGYTIDELEMIGRVGSGLDIATNMNAEQATTEMAQFANITKMAHSESENYASTIVALGNTTSTTESKISSMAQNIAAAGSQVGMSNSEILGLAAGLSSVGMEAEAGGTAISAIISQIDKDVATGSKDVATWAATAGMSADQFASAWRDKPIDALEALLTNMGEATKTGGNMSVMLENLGISSFRQTDAMKRLAGNSEALSTAINTANRAWQENTALSDEAANRNDSLAAKMEMLRNRVTAILEKIGKPLADALLDALDAAEPLFEAIESGAQAFSDMDEGQQRAIVSALALTAALGPVLSVVGRATGDIGSLITALGGGAEAFATLGAAAPVAALAILSVAAAADEIATIVSYFENLGLVKDATEGVTEVTTIAGGTVEDFAESVGELSDKEAGASESTATLAGTLKDATDGLRAAVDYAKEAKDTLGELGSNARLVDEYASTMKDLSSQSELTAAEQEKLKNAVEQYNSITGASIEIIDAARGTLSLLPGQIDQVTEAYKRQAEQKAYVELYNDAIKAQAENEMKLSQVTEQLGGAFEDAKGQLVPFWNSFFALKNLHTSIDLLKLKNSFDGLQQSSIDLGNNVSFLEGKLNELGDGSYKFASLEAAMAAAGVTGQQAANLTQEQLAQIRAAFDGTIQSISSILAKFGIAVGQTGDKAVKSVSDTTNNVAGAIDTGAQKAIEAQRRANEQVIKEQQRANARVLKEQQKANEQYNKELQKQFAAEEKQRSKELAAEEDQVRKANERLLSAQKKQFEQQEKALKSSLDKRYSERSKALEKEVDAERKKNEKILKDLKSSQAEQVKQYKAATDSRIKEMEREYQAKVKLLEEKDGTKGIDERIKQLEAESEAEKRVNTDKDRAEKIAELQREVDRAKSRRKRAEAEEALADYLAEIAYEQREQERKDEIDRLEEQKSLIKEETSIKKDALKEQYENEKEQYQQQRDERLERIQEANDLEYEKRKEALDLEIEQRREQNSQILEDLKARNDEQIQQMRELHEQQTASYKEMLDNRLSAMREAHETELENLKEQHSEIMDQVRDQQQEQLDSMRESQQDQLDALRQSQQDQLDALKSGGTAAVGAVGDTAKNIEGKTKETAGKVDAMVKKGNGDLVKRLQEANPLVKPPAQNISSTIIDSLNPLRRKPGEQMNEGLRAVNAAFVNNKPQISSNSKSTADAAERPFANLPSNIGGKGSLAMTNLATGIGQGGVTAQTQASNIATNLSNIMNRPANQSGGWGYDFMANFNNSMVSFWNNTMVHNVSSIAQNIANIFGHSTPKEGPFKGDDVWFYHFMQNLDSGLKRGTPMLMGTAYGIADGMHDAMNTDFVGSLIDNMYARESDLAAQSRRMAQIVSNEFDPQLSARYDASLNIAMAAQRQQRQTQWWLQGSAAPSIHVDLHMDGTVIDSSLDIRQTARELAFETARQLAASLG